MRCVRAGDRFAGRVGEGLYALCVAPEDGYVIEPPCGDPVFVSLAQLQAAARRTRRPATVGASGRRGRR